MNTSEMPVQYVKGVGEKKAKILNKLGIETLWDLVHYFPRSYLDLTNQVKISDIVPETVCCFRATVGYDCVMSRISSSMIIYKTTVFDETGTVHLTIFNNKYLADSLKTGEEYLFYGKVSLQRGTLQMNTPTVEKIESGSTMKPVYPLTSGITSNMLSIIMKNALKLYFEQNAPDIIPGEIRHQHSLCHEHFALKSIHFPQSNHDIAISRKRLIFEELLTLQTGMKKLKDRDRGKTTYTVKNDCSKELISGLPFTLTGAQQRVIDECISDMKKDIPMNRLVQGDVGSGKTVVAATLIYLMAKNGIQSAFMAPTEILATQHYETFRKLMDGTGIQFELLTGSVTAKKKREIKERLKSGESLFVVGTHALLTDDTEFSSLGLVITDEQHRFGVRQRGVLAFKGASPHTLVMSATPIPRTLSLIIYGDLDLSIIDELPKGRQKISTYAVDTSYHKRLYDFIKKHLDLSLQAYIVCPLVDESETADLTAATEYAKELSEKEFKDYRVGILHGKMKPKEKEQIMKDFSENKIQLLVSTTVIEVGVDVPNAVIMVIENAERFGLSQLHQLRGRVGRGKEKSHCVLVCSSKGENAKARMEIMCRTTDGFKIADKDLELRGPGDFFGKRQHGLPELKIADFTENMDIVRQTKTTSDAILRSDPKLQKEIHQPLSQRIEKLFSSDNKISLN
ncbi:MAG: ATP-dependent DNA helicase RecG [Clostridia bacterium]|nr:ATP-dependent DNA helicase RecG [Clostridia bacterium]